MTSRKTGGSDVIPAQAGIQSPVIPAQAGIQFLDLDPGRLEYLDLPATRPGRPELLLLHEGLGSVSMWRDFPQRLAEASGCRTVAYSRFGFGRSSPRSSPFTARFMHEEAHAVVPALRRAVGIARAVVVGPSTGASMALLHASFDPGSVAGVVAMAPLVFVETANLAAIRAARATYAAGDWRERLARHHDDADAVFEGWAGTWLDRGFRAWSIAVEMRAIRAPIVAILGSDDQYSTPMQVEALRANAVGAARFAALELPGCGHAPHRDAPREVLAAVGRLLDAV